MPLGNGECFKCPQITILCPSLYMGTTQIQDILDRYWGYSSFRPGQEEVISSVMAGKDTLALLPTGGGKSICYQVPGIALDGLCIVVSPLIALTNDQLEHLRKKASRLPRLLRPCTTQKWMLPWRTRAKERWIFSSSPPNAFKLRCSV